MIEQTLFIIKPDAYKEKLVGKIITKIEEGGFKITKMTLKKLTRKEAENLYDVHRYRDFFEPLVLFILEGPIIALILERENAIKHLRGAIGKTNPKESEPGTIRALYGTNKSRNAVHASDSKESFIREVSVLFPSYTIT